MYDAKQHYDRLYGDAPGSCSFRAETLEEFREWQTELRGRLEELLGLDRMREDLAQHVPHAERLEREELDGYAREKWTLWVEPTVPLPFYLLRPLQGKEPLPLVLCPHGHNHPHLYVGLYNTDDERKSLMEGRT